MKPLLFFITGVLLICLISCSPTEPESKLPTMILIATTPQGKVYRIIDYPIHNIIPRVVYVYEGKSGYPGGITAAP